ncbi:histidine kinase [Psychromonas sp. KJ10-2]|uniref:histidine kinase n=1 Tax=Psychromonas sp. KJ10-2 TaxID=3391822 RepID=UPI0039B5C22C
MTTTQSQSSNHDAIKSLTALRHEADSFINPNQLDRQQIQLTATEYSPLVANQLLQNKFFDVNQIHEANIELRFELIAIQQQLDQLSDQALTLKLKQLVSSIEYTINQYRTLIDKESSVIFVSQIIMFTFVALSALFLLFYCRHCIVRPLNKLEENVYSISNHHFNVDFIESNNEVGFLSTGLKSMSEELESLITAMQKKVFDKKTELETANESIQFLFTISQTLSTVKLTHPIIIEALNALAKQTNLSKLCLELVNGVEIDSDYGCATRDSRSNKRIPIMINGEPFGYLNYIQATPMSENTSIIVSFSSLLARALYQEEYSLQEQKLLLMDERGVIARELHDSIAQALSFLKIQCAVLNRQIDADSEKNDVKESVSNIKEAVGDAYVQLRSLLSTFRLNISESDFKEAVLVMISQLQKQTTAKIQLGDFESNFQTHANQHIHLLQIIREAMVNAMKHANCSNIIVNCVIIDQKVIISIIDDGIGIKEKPGKDNHYGIEIMNQRAAELNAKLEIKNLPLGTEIKLIFEI